MTIKFVHQRRAQRLRILQSQAERRVQTPSPKEGANQAARALRAPHGCSKRRWARREVFKCRIGQQHLYTVLPPPSASSGRCVLILIRAPRH
eukprot:scaffold8189_cov229-Pinguiococcus_pyrenoidosus.AAC.1